MDMGGCAGGKAREGSVQMVLCTSMHVHASFVFVRMKYSAKGARTEGTAREVWM